MTFISLLRLWLLGMTVFTTVSFVAGPPVANNSSLVANPNVVVADGSATSTIQVLALDTYRNVVPGASVALSATGGNVTFGAANGITDANGMFQTTISSTQVQTGQVGAVLAGNVTMSTVMQFVAGPPVAANSRLIVSPTAQVADNSNSITATVTLLDSLQHPVSGVLPTFSVSGSSTSISSPAATNASGQTSVTLTSTLAQSENVTVSAGSVTLTQPIAFSAGPPTTAKSFVSASPNTNIFANGSQATVVKVTLKDQYGNPAGNQNVVWMASSGNNTFTPASGVSNASGILTTQMTSLTAGARTVTATSGAAAPYASVSFSPTASTTTSSFVASPNQIAADGTALAQLTLTAKDANSSILSGVAVKLIDAAAGRTLTPASGVTDGNGIFAAKVAITQAGQHSITAQLTATQMTTTVKATPLTANCNQTIWWGGPPWPNVNSLSTYTAIVADFNGDGNQDIAVSDFGGHVQVLLGVGNKRFAPAVAYSVGGATTYMAMGDLNGDGRPDLVTSNAGPNNVSILMGNANGSFQNQVIYSVGALPRTVLISDLNGDGYADIATANQNANTVSVLFNTGNGTFGTQQAFPAGNQPYGIVAGKIASTNANDLMVTNASAGSISLLANAGGNTFAAPKAFTVGASPRALALGDVDGDGKLDVIVSNASNGNISLLLNQGNASFASQKLFNLAYSTAYVGMRAMNGNTLPDIVAVSQSNRQAYVLGNTGNGNFNVQYTANISNQPQGVNLFDVDGDGKIDILFPNGGATSSIPIAYNRGNYSFGTTTQYASGAAQFLLSGDYDLDGNQDFFVVNYFDSSFVYWGSATGAFSGPSAISVGAQPLSAAQGDLNGDGLLDLAIANSYDATISILFNQNNRTFAQQVVYAVRNSPRFIAVGDFDGNATPDLAITNSGSNNVSFYSNPGDGNLIAISGAFPSGNAPQQLAVADFNADGLLDFVVTNLGNDNVTLALNQNNFVFAAQANVTVGASPKSVVAGDINGDGLPDIVVGNSGSTTISILLNQNASFTTNATITVGSQPSAIILRDVNADGVPDLTVSSLAENAVSVLLGSTSGVFAAPAAYFSGSGYTSSIAVADFNRDGHIDYATIGTDSRTLNVSLFTGCQ